MYRADASGAEYQSSGDLRREAVLTEHHIPLRHFIIICCTIMIIICYKIIIQIIII